MKTNDMKNTKIADLRQKLMDAIKNDNEGDFTNAFENIINEISAEIRADYEDFVNSANAERDAEALKQRGVRMLTAKEEQYWKDFAEAVESDNFKQAAATLNLSFPETIIDSVMDKLRTEHPLLSKIRFIPAQANIRFLMNTNTRELASWGKLCDEIIKELTAGLKEVETGMYKISAFLPICKQMLRFGPAWIDRFVRETLYEALANGLEAAIVTGTGKDMPIGMDRQVGEDVTVVAGVYPQKEAIEVTSLDIITLGNLISLLSVDDLGRARVARNLIMLVNPVDMFAKVHPAITVLAPDGTYKNILPYPIEIIESPAVEIGSAILGIADNYFAFAGAGTEGIIDYSDQYHFLEDERVYLIKAFANGLPADDNSFVLLDISDLAPAELKVVAVDARELSDDATLASLKIGSLTLSPTFDPDEDTYTATTTNTTNIITAVPTNAASVVSILNGTTVVPNGTAATWATGSNTVTVLVTAEDGTTTETYTVTVTKS